MGNCFSAGAKSPSPVNSRPSSPERSSSKTSSSYYTTTTTTTTSTAGKLPSTSSSTFGQSTGSWVSIDGASLEGRITEAPNLRVFTFGELKSATRSFKPEMVLGEGGFGTVYKGWVDDKTLNPVKSGLGMVVAVKKLKAESMQGLEEWQSEVNFLGRISHPNLVKLLGYCWEDKELLLVYEFMPKGSLDNHLFRRGSALDPLSWGLRLKMVIGAARGLAFLHASEKQIIYRDLKASNILLDSNFNAKLSDFGLAKNGPTGGVSHITTKIMGTYGYAAPEYVATGHLYVKSDVYGFGVLLLEVLSGVRAFDPNRPSGQRNLIDWAIPQLVDRKKLARIMDPRLGGKYPSKGAFQTAKLTLRCLAGEPQDRPSMKEVAESLEQIEAITGRSRETEDVTLQTAARNLGQTPAHARSQLHPKHDGATPSDRAAHQSVKAM